MSRESTRLAERRRRLVAQAAAQRTVLVQELEPWRPRLALADQGVSALRYIGRHPALMVGAALLVLVLRPRGTAKWLQFGWMAWQFGRRLRNR